VLFSTVTALGLVRLVSFDRDFERFAGLQRLSLP
jgi:predicted nucleic acid-binding protein